MGRAIAYFSNGIGNFILAMPAFQAMASMSESGQVDLCLSDGWTDPRRPVVEEICRAWPTIGTVYSWPSKPFRPKDYARWWWTPHGENCEIQHVFMEHLRRPTGRPMWRSSLVHEADHYMDVARAAGYEGPAPEVVFPVADGPSLSELPRPIVALCNGAFALPYWLRKRWPHFSGLAHVLRLYAGATVVGVGNDGELDGVALDQDYTGKLSILETARVLQQADLLVTTDTGCMHLADVLQRPIVSVFGATLPSKNRPRNPKARTLIAGMDCVPCLDSPRFHRCTTLPSPCMASVTVGDVAALARKTIEEVCTCPK